MVETAQVVGSTEAETEDKPINMAATIWCDTRLLKEFKAAVKLQGRILADELNELFAGRLAEFRGVQLDPNSANLQAEKSRHYESLRKRQFELHQEQLRMLKFFEDQKRGFLGQMLRWYVQATTGKASQYMAEENCWAVIDETIDDDQKFRHQVCKFLAANPNADFAYDFVNLLERIREKRKLQRQMLQFQAESLGKEEYDKLEEAERLKREEEAKAEEQKRLEEAERKRKEEEQWEREREEARKRREEREKRRQETTGNNEATGENLDHDHEEEEYGEEEWNDEEASEEEGGVVVQ